MNYNKNSRFLKQNSYQPRFRDFSSSFSGHGGQTKESVTTYSTVFQQHLQQRQGGERPLGSTVSGMIPAPGRESRKTKNSGHFRHKSLMTSAAMIKPATEGTNAVDPGISRRTVHLRVPGGQMQ